MKLQLTKIHKSLFLFLFFLFSTYSSAWPCRFTAGKKLPTFWFNILFSISKDGRDWAILILMKFSHFDRTALYCVLQTVILLVFMWYQLGAIPYKYVWHWGLGNSKKEKIRRNLIYALFSQCKSDDDAGAPPYLPTSYDSLCSLNDHVNFFVSVVPFYSILRESTWRSRLCFCWILLTTDLNFGQ